MLMTEKDHGGCSDSGTKTNRTKEGQTRRLGRAERRFVSGARTQCRSGLDPVGSMNTKGPTEW